MIDSPLRSTKFIKQQADTRVIFYISKKTSFPFPDSKSEEINAYKDVKVAFSEAKYNSKNESIGEEETEDMASEEI